MARGEPGRDRSAEGASEDDDLAGRDAAVLGQIAPGRLRVLVSPLLGRAALALPVTAIVEDEHGQAELVEQPDRVEPMRDVPRVAVEEQQRDSIGAANEPGVQVHAVGRADRNVLVPQAEVGRRQGTEPAADLRQVDHAMLGHVDVADQRRVSGRYEQD